MNDSCGCVECAATKAEIRALKRRCWSPRCKRVAFIRDFMGWQWCLKHFIWHWRWSEGKFYNLTHARIF